MSNTCWSCGQETDQVLCQHCHKIQPPRHDNAFACLGLQPSFDLELPSLEKAYIQAQRMVHPDRFAQASKQEKVYASQQSAATNDAYQSLKDPILRAQLLLKLVGFSHPNIEHQTLDDQELLMEVLELRENLAAINSQAQLDHIQQHLTSLFDENVASMSGAFCNLDYARAGQLLNRLRYFSKLQSEAMYKRVG